MQYYVTKINVDVAILLYSSGVNYTILRLPFWYENFETVFRPHKVKHGVYAIGIDFFISY